MTYDKRTQDVLKLLKSKLPEIESDIEILTEEPLRNVEWSTFDDVAKVIEASGVKSNAIIIQLRDELENHNVDRRLQGAQVLFWMGDEYRLGRVEGDQEWLASFVHEKVADTNEDINQRCYLIRFAGVIDLAPAEMVPRVVELLRDSDKLVRCSAILSLIDYGLAARSCLQSVIDQLRQESAIQVWRSFERLVEQLCIHDEIDEQLADRLVPVLVEKVRGNDSEVKCAAIEILADVGGRAAIASEALGEAVLESDLDVAYSAAVALRAIGPGAGVAVPSLIKARHCEGIAWAADDALATIDPVTHATIKLEKAAEKHSGDHIEKRPDVFFIKPNKVKIGSEPPFTLAEREGFVVDALTQLGSANEYELERKSGVKQPGRLLKRIVKKHPRLASSFTLPGRRGRGGYRTEIKEQP